MQPRATIDFESRSACSIRSCGSWRYSLDPSTELLCLAARLPHWDAGRTALWHPAFPHLDIEEDGIEDLCELFAWIESGELVEAHNAWFERGIWTNKCLAMGWPAIAHEQWRCSAAKAAALSLPRSLDNAISALDLPVRKDMEGSAVMKKVVKPRNPLKSEVDVWGRQHEPCGHCNATGKYDGINPETGRKKKLPCAACSGRGWRGYREQLPEMPVLYHESRELFERLWAYCRQDVLAEEALSHKLPDLSPEETRIYLLDQRINERGFYLDADAIETALELIDNEFTELNAELATLTGGKVLKASQRAKMAAWFAENGLELDDTTADTIDDALDRSDLPVHVRRGLELVRTLGRSSTAKYEAMRNWICPDSRAHGGLLYHGASTGRWSGAGIQPQNFPRGEVEDTPEMMWDVLKTKDRDTILGVYGG